MSTLIFSPAQVALGLRHGLAARLAVLAVFAVLAGPPVLAADTGGSTVQAQDPLAAARSQVAARRWADALTELKRVFRYLFQLF